MERDDIRHEKSQRMMMIKLSEMKKQFFFLAETSVNRPMVHLQFLYFFRSLLDTFISLKFGNMSVVDRFLHYTDIFYVH